MIFYYDILQRAYLADDGFCFSVSFFNEGNTMKHVKFRTMFCVVLVLALSTPALATFPTTAAYPPASEDPVVDGSFTTDKEYETANIVMDNYGTGYFFKEHREDWTVGTQTFSDTITFFDNHYFTDPAYGQLDNYDMNSWTYRYGDTIIETWVFCPGNHDDTADAWWLDMSGIGSSNYPNGFDDDGTFLVRLNNDPSTDRIWTPGDPKPGDANYDYNYTYGVFACGGFNNSAYVEGYPYAVNGDREIYEWSITLNQVDQGDGYGAIPGVPVTDIIPSGDGGNGGGGNPLAAGICDPIWEYVTHYKIVCDWNPTMGGEGEIGGIGLVPDGGEWVLMGWDDSMHPVPANFFDDVPEPTTLTLLLAGLLTCFVFLKKTKKQIG